MRKEAKREAIKEEVKKEKRVITKKQKESRIKITQVVTKKRLAVATIILMLIAIIGATILTYKKSSNSPIAVDSELLRARTYEQFEEGNENIEGTDNVKFSAFFLRDLDGDGYAEKIKGTCKEVGKEDTLYMEIIVQTAGYLKNAKIEIDGKNFYFQTALPKDNELKKNYIGNNIKNIEFEELQNGLQKLLKGIVRSGDYSYSSRKNEAIGNNINNYSRQDNKVILTGTYVAEDGTETEITKEVNLEVDWYGETKAEIYSRFRNSDVNQYYNDMDARIDEINETIKTNFIVNTYEVQKQLNIYSTCLEGTIPTLNGFKPISVEMNSGFGDFEYNTETQKFTVNGSAKTNSDGTVKSIVTDHNEYEFEVIYPLEAYRSLGTETFALKIPVETYYEGYNNPNEEFNNPFKSNIAKTTIVANYRYSEKIISHSSIETRVGKYAYLPYYHYMISKQKPLRIYNGQSIEEKDDTYVVYWNISTGSEEKYSGITLKENKDGENSNTDCFIKSDATEDSMYDVTTNIGIYFWGADSFLNENGEIKVYNDETDELLVTFTKDNWNNYDNKNPYKYKVPVKHIRVETSETNNKKSLYVYNIKELDDEKITTKYEKEQFDNLDYIKTALVAYVDDEYLATDTHQAKYEAPISIAEISISKRNFSTQVTEKNVNIEIKTLTNEDLNLTKWKNGEFLIKLPEEILEIGINSVSINSSNVEVEGYEVVEQEGSKFIKINTINDIAETYTITVNVDITPDPRISTVSREIELYATNEEFGEYYYCSEDVYDVNSNLNTVEIVNKKQVAIDLISPNSLLTNQTLSDYDENSRIIVSPENLVLKPIYKDEDREKQYVRVGIQLRNNYSSTINEVLLIGKIPFEGNTYVLSGRELNSEFSTTMTDIGIEIPEELKGKVSVYYSENENPSRDIDNNQNGWKLAENVENWDSIKTYLIDFNDFVFEKGDEFTFFYTIEIPFGIELNKTAYSHHGIFFSLDTEEGKYRTQTEPNRIGIKIAEKYNLILTKYHKNNDKTISGATYRVNKLDENGEIEDSQTATTNRDGLFEMDNLYAEKVYEIREIKTPEDYELNEDVTKIVGHVNRETGEMSIEKLEGELKDEIQIEKNESDDFRVRINVEDEVKLRLRLIKVEKNTENRIPKVIFKISGEEINGEKRIYTKENGEATLKGLRIGEEYEIVELKTADGFYLDSDVIKFKVTNNEGEYNLEILSGDANNSKVELIDGLPELQLIIENEKVPTYNLKILKVLENYSEENIENIQKIGNAVFEISSYDKAKSETYITDENGIIEIPDLYLYEEGKNITGKYAIKEINSPAGYVSKGETINLRVSKNENGELEVNIENEGSLTELRKTIVNDNTITLVVQNKELFKLKKTDEETGEPLANVEFIIYEVDDQSKIIDYAKNINDQYVGKQNENGDYILTTNENGEITIPLKDGLYKTVENKALDGYKKIINDEYFKISNSKEEKNEDELSIVKIKYVEDLVNFSLCRNSAYYTGYTIELMNSLDIKDDSCYMDVNSKSFGDLNGNGITEDIKTELTTEKGLLPATTTFYGVFDGQGFEIKNLLINDSTATPLGLFRNIYGSTIKNLRLVDANIVGKEACGGIIGNAQYSLIDNCYFSGTVNGVNVGGIIGYSVNCRIDNCNNNGSCTGTNVGGIAGYFYDKSSVNCCYNNGNITGTNYVGGIIGGLNNSNIYKCNNEGNIYSDNYAGGICGYSDYTNNINYCSNNGEISGNSAGGISGYTSYNSIVNCTFNEGYIRGKSINSGDVGGIVGNSNGIISNSYNTGSIENSCYLGGIAGRQYSRTITNSYNTGNCMEGTFVGGLVGYSNYTKYSGCFNLGKVSSNVYIGQIIGKSEYIDLQGVYYLDDIELEGMELNIIGNECSNEYMKSEEFYNNVNLENGFEYVENSYPVVKPFNELLTVKINYIEDLLNLSLDVNNYKNYHGYTFLLERTIDFYDDSSYKDANSTDFGDLNEDGIASDIKTELTSGKGFPSIGNSNESFKGIFNGNNNEIKNIYINSPTNWEGLFGYTQSATIKKLGITGNISCGSDVAGLVGYMYSGNIIEECYNKCSVKASNDNVGGIVGYGYYGNIIKKCYNSGTINSTKNSYEAGGIIGTGNCIVIEDSYNIGNVNGNMYIGGIIGSGRTYCILSNVYNTANIIGNRYVGGIVGTTSYTSVSNSYNTGKVAGDDYGYAGGIIGQGDTFFINNCYNTGEVSQQGSNYIGGIIGHARGYGIISNSNNSGNIICEFSTGYYSAYLGGIAGYLYNNIEIRNCYNTGMIFADRSDGIVGGITGYADTNCRIINCYNSGTVKSTGTIGGIAGHVARSYVNNVYNLGSLINNNTNSNSNCVGGITGYTYSSGLQNMYNEGEINSNSRYTGGLIGRTYSNSVQDCYNVGNIISNSNDATIGGIVGFAENCGVYNCYVASNIESEQCDCTGEIMGKITGSGAYNAYYLDSIIMPENYNTKSISGTEKTSNEMKTTDFYEALNNNNVWRYKEGIYPTLNINMLENLVATTEISIPNIKNKYNITTEVENNIGGTISGAGEEAYEKVSYDGTNNKSIIMKPDENYIITKIMINGKDIDFNLENDTDSYIIPEGYFKNVKENIHIVVSYSKKEEVLKIVKKDNKDEATLLENAKFNIEYVETREITDEIKDKVDNGIEYVGSKLNDVTEEVLGPIIQNNTYYFENSNGEYISNNKKGYSNANSYMKIDLSNKIGMYAIYVTVRTQNMYSSTNATGRIVISENTNIPSTYDTSGQIVLFSSTSNVFQECNNYVALEGGNIYYLHFGLSNNKNGTAKMSINSVLAYEVNTNNYNFIKNGEKLESNNIGEKDTIANSYIPIDLSNTFGKYNLKVNTTVSSKSGYDYGYVELTDNTDRISKYSSGKLIYISGENTVEKSIELDGGSVYYLHLGYSKSKNTTNSGSDKFTINSIELSLNTDSCFTGDVTTNSKGEAKIGTNFGTYKVKEIEAPEGYLLDDTEYTVEVKPDSDNTIVIKNIKKPTLTVHHYIKDSEDKVAEDEEYIGNKDTNYTTIPHLDLEEYELEKDENGEYIIPENATGTYGEEDIEVTYYYVPKQIPLVVHHYILGTNTPVPLSNGENAETIEEMGDEGQPYTTEPISEEELSEDYELVEIPENAEGTYEYDENIVNYYYKLKEYEITTNVKPITMRVYNKSTNMVEEQEVKGGTISGENEAPYETVTVKEDSVKDLIITPDEGFSVKTITINGEDVEFEPDENNIVTLPKFTQMRNNKNIQVEFMANTYSVLVHHYIDGTEMKVPSRDGQVVEDEVKQGTINEIYATQISPDVHPMYGYVRVEGETSGEFGEEQKVVTYYYRLKYPEVETTIEKEAQTELVTDEGNEEYPLITKEDEQITYTIKYNVSIEDYKGKATIKIEDELPAGIDIAKSDIQEGIYDEASKTITWEEEIDIDTFENGKYEAEIEKEIKVSYKEQKTNEDLENTVKGTTKVYYPENHPEVDELEGPNKVLILDEKEDTSIVKQEYKARVQVKKIWNDNDNEREHRPESITITIKSNDNLYKEVVLNEINEWKYEEYDLPKYDENGEEINYTVEEKETNAKDLEFYRDVDIKKVIEQDEFETMNIFEIINGLSMDTKVTKTGPEKITKSEEALNYEIHLDSIVTNHKATGKVKIVDTLPYKIDLEKSFLDGGVYDEETNTITWEEEARYVYDGEGEEPEENTTEPTNIDNGDTEPTDNNDNPATNDVSNEVNPDVTNDVSNTITNEISNSVSNNTVQNEVTNETITGEGTADDNNSNNNINSNLVPVGAPMEDDNVYRLDISKYITIAYKDIVVGDGTIKNKVRAEIAIEDLELLDAVEDDTSTEMQIPGKVIVKYVDEATGEELTKKVTIEGLAGEPYTTEEKEFENYELKEIPENAEGEIAEGTTEVVYYYKHYAKVIVKYLEQNTNKVLAEEVLIEGRVADNYTTSAKTIEHYNFTYSTTNTSGKMTKEPIEVIYYYEWPHPGVPEPNPNNNTPSTTEKRSMVNRIVHPKTGDMVPVMAYSTIAIVLLANIMLARYNRVKLAKVTRVSRMSKMLESDRTKANGKEQKKKAWVKTKKARRAK